ncbi:MAG: ACP S-malonyltransferase [Myxococcota bacterium]
MVASFHLAKSKEVEVKVAWLFPGQGAQSVGMGKDVHEASPAARTVFARADASFGRDGLLSRLCFEGPAEDLTRTENTQPAILTTSMALLAATRERIPDLPPPVVAAGHSLGEYSALTAAGALALSDAVGICRARGRAMQEAVAPGVGAMAAIMNLTGEEVGEICAAVSGLVECANFNAPAQTVVAGEAEAVDAVMAVAKEKGGKAIALKVSAPFHCSLMAPAKEKLGAALADIDVGVPAFPVLANVDAKARTTGAEVSRALVDQVDHSVHWVKTIHAMRDQGVTHALEFGPGRVLAGLVKRIDKSIAVLSINGVDAVDKVSSFLEAQSERREGDVLSR